MRWTASGIRAPVRRPVQRARARWPADAWGTPADVFSLAAITFELLTARRPAGTGRSDRRRSRRAPIAGARIGCTPCSRARWTPIRRAVTRRRWRSPVRWRPRARGVTSAAVRLGQRLRRPRFHRRASPRPPIHAPEPPSRCRHRRPEPVVAAPPPASFEESWTRTKRKRTTNRNAKRTGELTRAQARAADSRDLQHSRGAALHRRDGRVPVGPARVQCRGFALGEHEAASDLPRFADEFRERAAPLTSRRLMIVETEPAHPRHEAQGPASVTRSARAVTQTPRGVHPVGPRQAREPESSIAATGRRHAARHARTCAHAMLPYRGHLILGLLLGFAGGYVVGGRAGRRDAARDSRRPSRPSHRPGRRARPREAEQRVQRTAVARPPRTPPPASGGPPTGKPAAAARASEPKPAAPRVRQDGRPIETGRRGGHASTASGEGGRRTSSTTRPFGKYAPPRRRMPGLRRRARQFSLSATDPAKSISYDLTRQPAAVTRPRSGRPPPDSDAGALPADGRCTWIPARAARGSSSMASHRGDAAAAFPTYPIGSHVVRLELPDHRAWTGTATVVSGKDVRVTGSLEPIR